MNTELVKQLKEVVDMIGDQWKGGQIIKALIEHNLIDEKQALQVLESINQIIHSLTKSEKKKKLQEKLQHLKSAIEREQKNKQKEDKQAEHLLDGL